MLQWPIRRRERPRRLAWQSKLAFSVFMAAVTGLLALALL